LAPQKEEKGYLNIKIVKGIGFSKKDLSRVEIGYSNSQTNAWIDAYSVKKSPIIKASDSPLFNFDFIGEYNKSHSVKMIFYGIEKGLVSKEKEYVIGTVKLDYQYFRAWYLQGKPVAERKVALTPSSEKEFKATRYVTITVKYDGGSLAPDKEGFTGLNANFSGISGPTINTRDISQEFNNFLKETSEILDEEINEATDALNPFGGPTGKMRAARMGSG